MKKFLIYSLFISSLLLTSCLGSDDDYEYASYYTYATVMESTDLPVPPSDDSDEDRYIYFEADNNETFYVSENKSYFDIEDLTVGSRIIIGIDYDESLDLRFDYSAILYDIASVVVGEHSVVLSEEESDAIGDDLLSFVSTNIYLTAGYLNLYVGFEASKANDVVFRLVENLSVIPDETDSNYLNLELRFDRVTPSNVGSDYERYVSFDMEQYRARLESLDGIILRCRTDVSNIVYVTVDSDELYD